MEVYLEGKKTYTLKTLSPYNHRNRIAHTAVFRTPSVAYSRDFNWKRLHIKMRIFENISTLFDMFMVVIWEDATAMSLDWSDMVAYVFS
jgi:hypothetical protein